MTYMHKSMAQRLGLWLTAAAWISATSAIAAAQVPTKKFVMHDAPKPIGAIQFKNDQGQARSLADFRGKVILLNVWATWCVPCRKEMPALDRLQSMLGDSNFEVVALSIDLRGMDVVGKFFAEIGLRNLAMYFDTSGNASRQLGVVGLPTTLLVNREGREFGRLIGPAEWDEPAMVEFIQCAISRDEGAPTGTDSKSAATPPCSDPKLDPPASGADTNRQP